MGPTLFYTFYYTFIILYIILYYIILFIIRSHEQEREGRRWALFIWEGGGYGQDGGAGGPTNGYDALLFSQREQLGVVLRRLLLVLRRTPSRRR